MKTLERDSKFLRSFNIMDYSLLLAVELNVDAIKIRRQPTMASALGSIIGNKLQSTYRLRPNGTLSGSDMLTPGLDRAASVPAGVEINRHRFLSNC